MQINLKSSRASKSRALVTLDSKVIKVILSLIIFGSLVAWVWFALINGIASAHFLIIIIAYSLIPIVWYEGELKNLSIGQNKDSLDQIIDTRLLGRLKSNTTPQDLVRIILKQSGGVFFANRFLIAPDFLLQIQNDQITYEKIWNDAENLSQKLNHTIIDSAIVTASIINNIPNNDQYLAQFNLNFEDIISGVAWYQHIENVIEKHKQHFNHGGIGRDLSFGWTPILGTIGKNITEIVSTVGLLNRNLEGHQDVLNQIIHNLSHSSRQNVALVGQVGVGKSTIVFGLAKKLTDSLDDETGNLKYNQIIELDASTIIANAKGRGEVEELLIRIINEAVKAKNIIIYLSKAELFLKDATGSIDLSNIFLPVLEGGALKIIVSLDEQQWLHLSQTNAAFAQLFNKIIVKQLNQEETMLAVEDQIITLEARNKIIFTFQALKIAYKLADRFIQDIAFPGKEIKLLESSIAFKQDIFITQESVQQAIESTYDVKVQTADTNEEKDVLLNLEELLHKQMVNQKRAVKVVSDALRRARAGVRNENKPIGTFLFLGPTGVGKTELSKALANVFFKGEENIVRIDLNEFTHDEDSKRLLAAGADDPFSLCAQILKKPYSVVLLDEIEKASPGILNMLLQLLDEGILRNSENKPVSFKDSIIIATSNAGADKIRKHIESGQELEQFEQQFIDELINSNIFKPEFINRFDEIILFRPLTKPELVQIVELLNNALNKTLEDKKVTVELTTPAKEYLAEVGYDPRLGARPLRRMMQRAVENLVAQKLLQNQIQPGQHLIIDTAELEQEISNRQ